jgi:predicted alpha/beta-fold hydrolase
VNDPLSPRPALPLDEANSNPYLKLEILNGGGHCGFMQQGRFFLGRRQGS